MSNPKVFEFAKEVGMTPLALMDKIKEWHLPVRNHMAELEPEVLEEIKTRLSDAKKPAEGKKKTATRKASPAKATAAKASPAKPAGPQVRRKAITSGAAAGSEAESPEVAEEESSSVATPTSVSAVVRKRVPVTPAQPAANPVAEAAAPVEVSTSVAESSAPVMTAKSNVVISTNPTNELTPASSPAVEEKVDLARQPARKKEVLVGTSGVASSATPVTSLGKRNIIGRMDLSRVQQGPSRGPGPGSGGQHSGAPGPRRPAVGGGGFAAPSRTGGRNIRAGFMAQPDIPLIEEETEWAKDKKALEKKSKKLESAAGGLSAKDRELEEQAQFNAVEFRKREIVFQPRKKKGLLARESLRTMITTPKASKRVVKINGSMKLVDLANEMGIKAAQLVKSLMTNGVQANMNTALDFDTIALIVPEFNWEAVNVAQTTEKLASQIAFGDLDGELTPRPPVVTVMGHVDHGKTSLLDAIRKTDVAAGEAGGITQHIGAYSVHLEDGSLITFLDTPGHEAFTAMRARGATATDIAVIVVAADDGTMPQTAEAINHAKAAKVPIIVAVNKIDKPGANIERIKQQMTEFELVPEEWGGSTIFVPVSALKKTGIKELLEQIKLVAEMQELKANPNRSATGIVIEAKLEKGKGPVATLLVKDGTIKIGQYLVAGQCKGRVRSLVNDRGERVESAGPGMPVEVLGLESAPMAGDRFDLVKDDSSANELAELRRSQLAALTSGDAKKLSLEDIFSKVTKGDVKELTIILKADVQGSLEALQGMLAKLVSKEVKVRVIHAAVGGITESDVLLAQTSKGIIIGFNVRPDGLAQAKAKQLGVDIRSYSIIYELVDELKKAMAGLLAPEIIESQVGRAEVRNIFTVPKIGTIAGSFVVDGKIQRSNLVRVVRDGKIIYEGKLGSLKRFKDDAKEVASGFECGIGVENFNDIKVGDVIEAYVKEQIARELILNATT